MGEGRQRETPRDKRLWILAFCAEKTTPNCHWARIRRFICANTRISVARLRLLKHNAPTAYFRLILALHAPETLMNPPPMSTANRAKAWIAWVILLALSLWLIQWLWRPLAWGGLLALGLTVIHERFCKALRAGVEGSWRYNAATALFCLMAGALVMWPLLTVGATLATQIDTIAGTANQWVSSGAPLPEWASQAPKVGPWLARHWMPNGTNNGIGAFIATKIDSSQMAALAGSLGLGALARVVETPIILAGFFWALAYKRRLAERMAFLHEEVFAEPGQELITMLGGVGRTVFGSVVILGLSEGTLLWCAFALAGVPSPALFGFAAGFGAAVPLISPLICAGAVAYVALSASQPMALALALFCLALLFVLDPLARSRLSGAQDGGPRAIWLYAAFLGGFSQFGLIGLFVGPMAVSACAYYWRLARRGLPRFAQLSARGAMPAATHHPGGGPEPAAQTPASIFSTPPPARKDKADDGLSLEPQGAFGPDSEIFESGRQAKKQDDPPAT